MKYSEADLKRYGVDDGIYLAGFIIGNGIAFVAAGFVALMAFGITLALANVTVAIGLACAVWPVLALLGGWKLSKWTVRRYIEQKRQEWESSVAGKSA